MPNRIIKESIRTSYEVDELSPEAEVTFYRLITFADDYGRFPSDARVLQSSLFPLKTSIRSSDFTRWIAELISADLVQLYIGSDGKPYGAFTTWNKHQNVRATKSKYPDAKNRDTYTSIKKQMEAIKNNRKQLNTDDINCNQLQSNVPVLDTRTRISILDTRERDARAREGKVQVDQNEYRPPTIEHVLQYAIVHSIPEKVAKEFFWHYDGMGWEDKHGKPIKNWISWLNKWQSREAQFKSNKKYNHGTTTPDIDKIAKQNEQYQKRKKLQRSES